MRFTNRTQFHAAWTMGYASDGREQLIIIAKATYVLPEQGQSPRLADEQLPLVESDEFSGEPGVSAPLYESDYAHFKPMCDVLLVGSAYAPEKREVQRTTVALQVNGMNKQFSVVGKREWRRTLRGTTATSPEPFTVLPLSYDHAFGGTDRSQEAQGQASAYRANPVGRGYFRKAEHADGQPLPTTEQLDRPIESCTVEYLPMALSPLGRNWSPRAGFAGTYDQAWIENTAPLWPADFDARYFQAAPSDQTIAYPVGGESVVLRNLTEDGARAFQLPALRMPVTFMPHRAADITQEANIDTVLFEPDRGLFSLTYRAVRPMRRSVFDIQETIVGEMPRAWHRARRSPGKPYYAGLGELVRARRGRA